MLWFTVIGVSWTDWGLWTECDYGTRSRTQTCFKDKSQYDTSKKFYEFEDCAVEQRTESKACAGK